MSIERRDMYRPNGSRIIRISEAVLDACTKHECDDDVEEATPTNPRMTRGCNLFGAIDSGGVPYECTLKEQFGRDQDGRPIVKLVCEGGEMTDSRALAHTRDNMCHKVYRIIEESYKRPHTYNDE